VFVREFGLRIDGMMGLDGKLGWNGLDGF